MVEKLKFAIVGAGNLGQCMAAHLALLGHDVNLGNRSQAKLTPIQEADNRIRLEGELRGEPIEGNPRLNVVSTDFEKVVAGRDLIMVTVPADGHGFIASEIAPFIEPDQHVVLHPGHTFGALEARKIFEDRDAALADVTVSEIQSSLFTTRAIEPGHVFVAAIKNRMSIATLPSNRSQEVFDILSPIYPEFWVAENVLHTSLDNLNCVAHPVVSLLNASRIERQEDFLFYQTGVSPAVGKVMEIVDEERMSIARAMDITPRSFNQWFRDVYTVGYDSLYELFSKNPAYAQITGPNRLDTRYVFEDLPTGLLPMISLGKVAGVETPLMQAVCVMWGKIFDTDFTEEARTLESLGLDHLSIDELIHYVTTGER